MSDTVRNVAGLTEKSWILPAIIAAVLSIPVFGFPFIWDDYTFLHEARSFGLHSLLPHKPLDPFYRPISRELYFALIRALGTSGALIGHLLNLTVLTASIALLVRLTTQMVSPRAGLFAGLTFASLGVVPFLVGWVSGIQDLLAIFFVLLALSLRSQRREWLAITAAACGLLSKESAVVFLPILAALPWIQGVQRQPAIRGFLVYGGLGLVWALCHPGIQRLIQRGFSSTETDYVGGVTAFGALGHLGRYSVTLLNLPQPDTPAPWLLNMVLPLIVGIALVWAAGRLASALPVDASRGVSWPRGRILLCALYMMVAPLLLTAATVQGWSPYYAAVGGLGFAILSGLALSSLGPHIATALLLLFATFGIWQRGQAFEAGMTTERNFRETALALAKIEQGFKFILPKVPRDARIVTSVQVRGVPGVYVHMYHLQALRVWYDDPSVETVKPEVRRTRARPEYFFVVTADQQVATLDPVSYSVMPSTVSLDYSAGERALRAYAMGVAASGDAERAAVILVRMPEVSEHQRNTHRRLAAAILYAAGRSTEGYNLIDSLPPLPRQYALENIAVFLAEPLPGLSLDRELFRAFAIDSTDTDAMLWLASWFDKQAYAESGLRMVTRLEGIRANDSVVRALREQLESTLRRTQKYDLPESDSPQPAPLRG
jgi:hypothetical protein